MYRKKSAIRDQISVFLFIKDYAFLYSEIEISKGNKLQISRVTCTKINKNKHHTKRISEFQFVKSVKDTKQINKKI